MRNYKELPKSEKIERIKELRWLKIEMGHANRYLAALEEDDTPTIDYYEGMGAFPYQIILNARAYDRAKLFGFTQLAFDEYGWLEYPLEEVARIDAGQSYIRIAKGVTGFAYGLRFTYGDGGGGWAPSIWDNRYETSLEAEKAGLHHLKLLMEGELGRTRELGEFNLRLINNTIKEIIRLSSPVQMELF